VWLSILAAALAITGSVIGLTQPAIYARLTPVFLPQALAQDVANLAIASPVVQSLRGEAAAWGVVGPIGTLTGVLLGVLVWLMSSVQRGAP
jgi:hypothetical protein